MINPLTEIKYLLKRIKRVIDFVPHIWNSYDYDYRYAVDLFSYQLSRTADFLESDTSICEDAVNRAKKIRTAVKLLNKVYDEDYGTEYMDILEKMYGSAAFGIYFKPLKENPNLYELKYEYEQLDIALEIENNKKILFEKSHQKQEKAHDLVWRYISHNIRDWWD